LILHKKTISFCCFFSWRWRRLKIVFIRSVGKGVYYKPNGNACGCYYKQTYMYIVKKIPNNILQLGVFIWCALSMIYSVHVTILQIHCNWHQSLEILYCLNVRLHYNIVMDKALIRVSLEVTWTTKIVSFWVRGFLYF
jgi:hypothetical protein